MGTRAGFPLLILICIVTTGAFATSAKPSALNASAHGLAAHTGSLQAPTTTLDLFSGNGAIGRKDAEVQWLDGLDWTRAWIISPNPSYDVLPGTNYVFSNPSGCCPEFTRIRFRIRFVLPADFSNASISGFVHADNAATVILNESHFVIMPDEEIGDNFRDPPASFEDSNPADFHPGVNTLRFVLHNFHGPAGLDFHMQVTYDAG